MAQRAAISEVVERDILPVRKTAPVTPIETPWDWKTYLFLGLVAWAIFQGFRR